MYVGTQIRPRDDSDYRVWAQLGVRHVCVDPPGNPHHWSLDDLNRHREHVESFGLTLDMVQLPLSSRPIEEQESPYILMGKDPQRQREIVFLHYYADLDYASIAEALEISPGTVGATLNAARRTGLVAVHTPARIGGLARARHGGEPAARVGRPRPPAPRRVPREGHGYPRRSSR